MMPILRVASPQLLGLPVEHSPPTYVDTRSRDEAIRIAFAAFDMPTALSDSTPEDPANPADPAPLADPAYRQVDHDAPHGVPADAINDYLKCIFGFPHQAALIESRAAHYLADLDQTDASTLHARSVSRLTALAAFYIGLCQGCAFNAAGDFDTKGLIDFIATRLAVPTDALEKDLIDSALGASVFMAMQRHACASPLAIYGSQGQAIHVPSPSLRFDGVTSTAACNGYLRNVTISAQTVHAVDMTDVDLSGAYIDNCVFIDVSFANANLYNVVFNNTFAAHCHFDGANLVRAKFRDVRLSHSEFLQCKMASSSFDASAFLSTRFEHCDLRDMTFDNEGSSEAATRLEIAKSEFQSCDMTGTRMRHVRWCDGGLIDCVMWDAMISHSLFTRTTWRHHPVPTLTKPPLSGAKFSEVQFHECALAHLNGNDSDWKHCVFEKGNLADASWRRSVLSAIRFAAVAMPRAHFDNAVCQDLRIEAMCELDGVSFAQTTMTKVRFDGGIGSAKLRMRSVDFGAAVLDGVDFIRCHMGGAKFVATQLQAANFVACNLNNSDFSLSVGADLLRMMLVNVMRQYRSDDMTLGDGDIGSLRSSHRRAAVLNHHANRDCLLANALTGSTGVTPANLVLQIADMLLHEARDPLDSDPWMITALSVAYKRMRLNANGRARIDVHLRRVLQRHSLELNDLAWRARRENHWWVDAVTHARRLRTLPEINVIQGWVGALE